MKEENGIVEHCSLVEEYTDTIPTAVTADVPPPPPECSVLRVLFTKRTTTALS